MLTDVHLKHTEELYTTPIVQQTALWSEVKHRLGSETLAVQFSAEQGDLFEGRGTGRFGSDLLVVVHQINAQECIAYVPYGPELEPDEPFQGLFLEELSECLRSFLPLSCILIRYDLCWESYWARDPEYFDAQGHFTGEPAAGSCEIRFNFSTVNGNFRKTLYNFLPAHTFYLDLRPEPEQMLRNMKPKTRYNIGLAGRKGVTVRSSGWEDMNIWYRLYTETAGRNHIRLHEQRHFEALLSARDALSDNAGRAGLLIAGPQGVPLGALFLSLTGNRGSYLFGASSGTGRNLMAPYALQWEAILRSRKCGCTEYDMFGTAPAPDPSHPLYGLYKFKAGFGGSLYHSMGCWDYPLQEEAYQAFRMSELCAGGFHQ